MDADRNSQGHSEGHLGRRRLGPPRAPGPLRRARLLRGLTQLELSQQVGISREQLANLELGKATPLMSTAYALARALGGVDVTTIFPPNPEPIELVER